MRAHPGRAASFAGTRLKLYLHDNSARGCVSARGVIQLDIRHGACILLLRQAGTRTLLRDSVAGSTLISFAVIAQIIQTIIARGPARAVHRWQSRKLRRQVIRSNAGLHRLGNSAGHASPSLSKQEREREKRHQ